MHEITDTNGELERVGRQIRRRRDAAIRCEPLSDGRRDPLEPDRSSTELRELDAWAAALLHLRTVGLAGLPPADVRGAMASHGQRYAAVMPRRRVA